MLYSLHKRRKDPITARTIENYLNYYIANANDILKKIEKDIEYKNPEVEGVFGMNVGFMIENQKNGYFNHEAMNINFTLVWLLNKKYEVQGGICRKNLIQEDFLEAHQECIQLFKEKSGVQKCIKSWTSARELWISKRQEK